jgi:hypothetical protein
MIVMAQSLEIGTAILYAGAVPEHTGDAGPPDMQMWNWRRLGEDEQAAVNEALAASREAEAGLLAGLIR